MGSMRKEGAAVDGGCGVCEAGFGGLVLVCARGPSPTSDGGPGGASISGPGPISTQQPWYLTHGWPWSHICWGFWLCTHGWSRPHICWGSQPCTRQ